MLSKLYQIYVESYEPNDDVKFWVKKHAVMLQKETLEEQFKRLQRMICATKKQKLNELEKVDKERETSCAINTP